MDDLPTHDPGEQEGISPRGTGVYMLDAPGGLVELGFYGITEDEALQILTAVQHVFPLNPYLIDELVRRRYVRLAGRPLAIDRDTASRWVADIRAAVAQCHIDQVRVNYQNAGERMKPFPYSDQQFGRHVRSLAKLGYKPWPQFFEQGE